LQLVHHPMFDEVPEEKNGTEKKEG
jgi:hypothetical protein